jgi:hypothetical protein
VKIIVHGPASSVIWDGTIESFMPDQPFEIDDGNAKAVTWARMAVSTGLATLVEDVKASEPKAPKAPAAKQAGSRA